MQFIDWLKDWQTLATGILAVLAAVIAFLGANRQAKAALRSAKLAIDLQSRLSTDAENRRRYAFAQAMAAELRAFHTTLNARAGLIDQHRNTELLSVPSTLTARWEDLALLSTALQQDARRLAHLIENINGIIGRSYSNSYDMDFLNAGVDLENRIQAMLKSLIEYKAGASS